MATHAVRPVGRYPDDLNAVKAAIAAARPGDTILLKATDLAGVVRCFHFGDDGSPERGSINLTEDLTILGEAMAPEPIVFPNGQAFDADLVPDRTVVYGGRRPFQCSRDNENPTTLRVRNLYFACPALAALQVQKSAGLEVSHCVIAGVTGADTSFGFRVAVGIEATSITNKEPLDLTGDFKVFDNIVSRGVEPEAYQQADTGIVLQWANMKAEIHDNDVRNFAQAGIGVDKSDGKTVRIWHNRIQACGYGDSDGQGHAEAGGIGVRRTSAPAPKVLSITENTIIGGAVPGRAGVMRASKNGITLWGSSWVDVHANDVTGTLSSAGIRVTAHVNKAGIRTASTHNRITGNHLDLTPGADSVVVDADCPDNLVQGNQIRQGAPA